MSVTAIIRLYSEVDSSVAPAMPTVPDNASTLIMSKSGANTIGRRADTLVQVVSNVQADVAFEAGFTWLMNNVGLTAPKGMRIEPDVYTINANLNVPGTLSNFFMYGNLAEENTSIILRADASAVWLMRKVSGPQNRDLRFLNFTLDGNNISGRVFSLEDVDGLLLQNMIFERSNHSGGPNVYASTIVNGTVESCISRNHTGQGDCIAIGGVNIRVFRCDVSGIVAQNGSITSGTIVHGEIAYNNVHDKWTYGGVSIENQSGRTENLRIHDNTFTNINNQGLLDQNGNPQGGNAILFVSSVDGQPDYDFKGIEIDHNTLTNIGGSSGGIKLNVSDSNVDRLTTFVNVHDNTLTHIGTTSNHHGIYMAPVKFAEIENNTIDDCSGWVIRIRSPEGPTNSTVLNDVHIVSDNIQIKNNTVTNSGARTYYTVGCTNVTLSDNTPLT